MCARLVIHPVRNLNSAMSLQPFCNLVLVCSDNACSCILRVWPMGEGHEGSQVFVSCLFPRRVSFASQQPSQMAKGIGNIKVVISASRVSKVWILVLGV